MQEKGGSQNLFVKLNKTWLHDVTVTLGYSDVAKHNVDYTAATSVVIKAGTTQSTVPVKAIDDPVYEGNEWLRADITKVVNAVEKGTQFEKLRILDDDDRIPEGSLDGASCRPNNVWGTVVDPDVPNGAVTVQFYIDGQYQGETTARPKYEWKIPNKYFDGNQHTVETYAISIGPFALSLIHI